MAVVLFVPRLPVQRISEGRTGRCGAWRVGMAASDWRGAKPGGPSQWQCAKLSGASVAPALRTAALPDVPTDAVPTRRQQLLSPCRRCQVSIIRGSYAAASVAHQVAAEQGQPLRGTPREREDMGLTHRPSYYQYSTLQRMAAPNARTLCRPAYLPSLPGTGAPLPTRTG